MTLPKRLHQARQGERLTPAWEDLQWRNARRVSNAALIRGSALQLAARRDHDCYDALPGLTMPTLLCAGRFDGIAPLPNMEALAAAMPQATLQVFEGGHLFLRQDRAAWPAILQWLTEDTPGPQRSDS
ncbi:MAG: alpha/beta fold hydrolase [Pseudomonadales bacterium]